MRTPGDSNRRRAATWPQNPALAGGAFSESADGTPDPRASDGLLTWLNPNQSPTQYPGSCLTPGTSALGDFVPESAPLASTSLWPRGFSSDAFFAGGGGGKIVMVLPSERAVVVSLGTSTAALDHVRACQRVVWAEGLPFSVAVAPESVPRSASRAACDSLVCLSACRCRRGTTTTQRRASREVSAPCSALAEPLGLTVRFSKYD